MANSALIDDLLRQFAENPRRVFARLANEYRKAGELDTAIEICRAHVPLQPTYISGYIVLGQALFESGQTDEARSTFETALGLDPENLIALRQLGDIAKAKGDIDGARAWYRRLLEVDPQNPEIVTALQELDGSSQAAIEEPVSWSDIHPEQGSAQPVIESAPEPSQPAESAAQPEPASAREALGAIDFDILASFAAEPRGEQANVPAPSEPVAEAAPPEPREAPRIPEPSPWHEETAAAPAQPEPVSSVPAPEPEPVPPVLEAAPVAAPAAAPVAREETRRDEPVPAFITETMAELYLQQGHREQALDIYRLLVAMRPDDASLRERVQRLQQPSGRTARAFFSRFADRRPPGQARPAVTESAPPVEAVPTAAESGLAIASPSMTESAEPVAPREMPTEAPPPVGARAAEPAPSVALVYEGMGGLDAFFPGGSISPADERAAATLAGGYASNGATGRPARTADDVLSLDDVFGGGHPADTAHVSYDQFFSKRDPAVSPSPSTGDQAPAPAQPRGDDADLELFHAWLEGLKK